MLVACPPSQRVSLAIDQEKYRTTKDTKFYEGLGFRASCTFVSFVVELGRLTYYPATA